MGIKKELGKKIKRMRLAKGYTQDKLSEIVDISQKALSSIEVGENFVTEETLDKLICALETTSEELFATNNVKDAQELKNAIAQNLVLIGENSEKLELVYNLTKSLTRIQLKASQQGNYVAKSIENSYNIPKREVLLQKAQIYVKIFPIRKLNEY